MSFAIKLVLSSVLVIVSLTASCDGARILGFFPTPSKSHLIIHSAIANAIAEQGHDVTVVSTHKLIKKNPPYRYIQLDIDGYSASKMSETVVNPPPFYKKIQVMMDIFNSYANSSVNHPKVKKLMAEESFDLVILGYFFNEFLLGIPAHFKCPVVMSFMVQTVPFLNGLVGNPNEAAYVPSTLFGGKQPLGFFKRVVNFLFVNIGERFALKYLQEWYQEDLYNKNFPADKYPSFEEMKKNVSLVLTNSHFSQGTIRPNVPGMVEIGGIQIKEKPDPLPEDLKSIMDNATEHGVVYFSLGSNVQGSTLDPVKLQALFNVLSQLPQTVLWKWGDSVLPGESPNIIYKSWLPQDDILPHQNVKLFITHGGGGSVVESSFHGVPMVGIPIFADQSSNMEGVVKQGFGLSIDYSVLTEEGLRSAVNEVMSNKMYRENVQRFSKVYKDRPMTAKQTAVFWLEYVLRHHGAPHMQSPAVHMNFFQLASLDVIGFLVACIYVIYKVFKFIFLFVKSMIWRTKSKSKKE
ncbi:UDP-glycosyltransferase UGT5-like [Episyrphus balteatus]|uniref:UDP-glycosyltransferase UGT5-like n=1 Tax=Episyrphus balteatus TaxID=286459 RepID=UPI00248698BC|nr:UDP-glycosyltransferase UGT5-like [Episyrphus balteatus]